MEKASGSRRLYIFYVFFVYPAKPLKKGDLLLPRGGRHVGVLAAEALDASGGVQKLLLAGEEGVAGGADFHVDIAPVCGPGCECITAGAMHANFVIIGMDSGFHNSPDALGEKKILQEVCRSGQIGGATSF